MGRDKLGLTVGGKSLISRVYDVVRSHCDEVLVVGSSVGGLLSDEGAPKAQPIPDLRPGRAGPLAGIEAALTAARHERVFVAAGDLPFIPKELVGFLLEIVTNDDVRAAVPRHDARLHPLCAAYRRDVLSDLTASLNAGVRAVHTWLDGIDGLRLVDNELMQFGDPETFLMNVNSPEDLERARHLAGSGKP
ncbi:hypothetical protein BH23ACT11_BH23ACT11_08550 [soil metagenome]